MNLLNILLQQIRQFLWKKLPYLPYNRSFNRCISRKWREKNDVLLVKPSCFIAFLKTSPSNTHIRRVYWTLSCRHLVERSSNQCYFMLVRHEKQNAMDAQNVWRYSCCVPMSYFKRDYLRMRFWEIDAFSLGKILTIWIIRQLWNLAEMFFM